MISRPRSFRSLSEFTRLIPNKTEAKRIFHELLDDPNDRAAGITAAAYLESSLQNTLIYKLKKIGADNTDTLFRDDGPLGTFSAKIILASAIQLLGEKATHDFDCIRVVRNAFAHSKLKATFGTTEVENVCLRLSFPNWDRSLDSEPKDKLTRIRFLATCTLYNEMLAELATPGNHHFSKKILAR